MGSWINPQTEALLVFIVTYFFIATGRREGTIAAMVGAVSVWALGLLTESEMLKFIDMTTLGLLFGMMVIVGALREAGFFRWIGILLANFCGCRPSKMFILFTLITAVLSAVLDNVTTILFITAVTIEIMEILRVNPVPYIISEIIASNIGGTATQIGGPPNIIISSAANFTFMDFIYNAAPVAFTSLPIITIYLYYHFKSEFVVKTEYVEVPLKPEDVITDKRLFIIGSIIFILTLMFLSIHDKINLNPAAIVLLGGVALLFVGGEKMPEVLEKVEWSTLIFLACLFIIVGSLEKTGLIHEIARLILPIINSNELIGVSATLWIASLSSALIDNVPFTVAFIPILRGIQASQAGIGAWWALALGAGFGGNGTVIGSSSNIVAIGVAFKRGYKITFMDFLKIGMITLAISTAVANAFLILKIFSSIA